MRIRSHLLLLVGCVLVPGLIGAGVAVQQVRDGARQEALRGLQETVRATALLVDGEVQRSIGALTALGHSSDLASGNLKAFYDQAAAVNQLPDVWTLLLDETGLQRLNTVVPFGTPPPARAAQERVREVLSTGKPLITDVIIGPVTRKLITTIYVPAGVRGETRFVVAQAFSVEHWQKRALRPQGRESWVVAVLDRQGRFVSRSHRASELLGQSARPELVAAAAAAPSGMIRHKTLEDVDVYDAFAKSTLTGWTVAVAAPVESIEASATKAAAPVALGLLVALVAGAISLTLLGRRLLTDVEIARRAAGALGRGEQPPPASSSVSELSALHDSLQDAGRLLASERSARTAVELERSRLLADEQAARQAAQQQNAAKDKFLAMLGHELRNPLAAITNAGEVLAQLTLPERGRRFVDMTRRQTRHLARIVDDLLDSSRLVSGKLILRTAVLELGACATACVESLREVHGAAGARLTVQAEEVWVQGDAVRLEQVLSNLIHNAVKYSPPQSTIRIFVGADGDEAVIRVEDQGRGIEPDLLPHVFEPFVQGPVMPGVVASGLGIGLALVEQLVHLHRGSVEALRNPAGRGSTFLVRLPRIAAPANASAKAARPAQHGCSVLLVEDNADAREATAALLRMMGYRVSEAEDGEAALAAIAAEKPRVVLMDIGLPGRSGHDVAEEVRRTPGMADIALVALSGYGRDEDRARSRKAGFDAHLAKPADPEQLAAEISKYCGRR